MAVSTALTPNGVDILEELTAEDGMCLTQKGEVPLEERIIATQVMLGKGRSSSEWKEITEREAEAIQDEQAKLREQPETPDTE